LVEHRPVGDFRVSGDDGIGSEVEGWVVTEEGKPGLATFLDAGRGAIVVGGLPTEDKSA
jgi:hypothetical protein